MTERALSEEAMLAGLRDIHLPAEAAGGPLADIAAAVALAGVAALLLSGVLRLLSHRRVREPPPDLRTELAELGSLPEEARRVALLHLLKSRAPDRFAALRGQLYRPESRLTVAALEGEVRKLA